MLVNNFDRKWAIHNKDLVLQYFDSFNNRYVQQKQELPSLVDLSLIQCFQDWKDRKYVNTEIPAQSFVRADEFLLNVLIDNIIMNAFRHSRETRGLDEAKINIRAEKTRDEINIIISDNGNGIPSDKLAEIFDLAYSTTGGGVGLTVAYYIVRDLGGTIDVASEVGKGLPDDLSSEANKAKEEADP
jgi:signal transduction histidine kinase